MYPTGKYPRIFIEIPQNSLNTPEVPSQEREVGNVGLDLAELQSPAGPSTFHEIWESPEAFPLGKNGFSRFSLPHPDLLHLRGARAGEQGGLGGLHGLQPARLPPGLPRHLVRFPGIPAAPALPWPRGALWALGLVTPMGLLRAGAASSSSWPRGFSWIFPG